jgi:rSAM/selenodomain-associated transferase 1
VQPNQLLVFVKAPRPGFVKTRLAMAIGGEAACAAYCRVAGRLLEQLTPLDGVELRFAPDDAEAELRPWLRRGWKLSAQGPGDLGVRLHRAVESARAAGAERVVAIGSDCPDVTVADVESAWEALQSHDVVLGPASDGGYWLIGLKESQPRLFDGIAWSTETVFAQTLQRCHAVGLLVHQLRQLDDIDVEEDWRRFLEREG